MTEEKKKFLRATSKTQGERKDDFNHCTEGELVFFGFECDRDKRRKNGKGGCGCRRAFTGIDSKKAITTAEIVGITFGEYETLFKKLEDHYRTDFNISGELTTHMAANALLHICTIAGKFNEGDIIEKRGKHIAFRRHISSV